MTGPAALEALARRIAEDAHAGQVDKLGEPYIGHVSRVAERLEDPLDRPVAWLHDVVEDTSWTLSDLREARIPLDLLADVDALTHYPGSPRDLYYRRLRQWPRAVRVKLADIADNTDPARLSRLPDTERKRLKEKYRKAREALTLSETPPVRTGP